MSEAENNETAQPADAPEAEAPAEDAPQPDAPAEEPTAEDAPAEQPAEAEQPSEEGAAAPAAAEDAEPAAELSPKQRRKLARSQHSGEARAPRSPDERAAERAERRARKATVRRLRRAAERAKRTPGTGTPTAEREPGTKAVRQGTVVSDKADKTITVRIEIVRRHPRYEKIVRRSRTVHAHDENNDAHVGDLVRVIESRPRSRMKRWRLVEVLEKAR